MYIGADWRMNIMRVGCIALTLVALNMVPFTEVCMVEWRVGVRVGGEVERVVLRANVTRRLKMGAGALKNAEPLADKAEAMVRLIAPTSLPTRHHSNRSHCLSTTATRLRITTATMSDEEMETKPFKFVTGAHRPAPSS